MLVNMAECNTIVSVQTKRFREMELPTANSVPPIEIHQRMKAFYGEESADSSTVRHWVASFRDVSQNKSDKQRIGGSERYCETLGELKASLPRFRCQTEHPLLQYNSRWHNSTSAIVEV